MDTNDNTLSKALNYYNEGLLCFANGNLKEAKRAFLSSIELDEPDPDVFNKLGATLYKLGEIDEAIKNFKKAIELEPDFIEVYNNLGVAYTKKKEVNEAKNYFNKAIEVDPDYALTYLNFSLLYKLIGNLKLTMEYYFKALKLYSEKDDKYEKIFEESLINIQENSLKELFKIDDYDLVLSSEIQSDSLAYKTIRSLNTFQNFKEIETDLAKKYFSIAVYLQETSNSKKAINYYKKAVQYNKNFFEAYFNLAIEYQKIEEYALAEQNFLKCPKIQESIDVFLSLAIVCFNMYKYEDSKDYLKKAEQLCQNNADSLNNIGYALFSMKLFEEALSYFQKAEQLNNKHIQALYNIAVTYTNLNDLDKALEYYSKLIKIDPENYSALNNIGAAYENKRQFAKAKKFYTEALDLNPHYSIAYENLLLLNHRKESN